MMTATEQEYLKQIYLGLALHNGSLQTRELAMLVNTKPSSVTDMLKRLKTKGWISYQKNKGFSLTEIGTQEAIQVIRRHRLWELFLTENLKIDWKKVHGIASNLQAITHQELVNNLEAYLGFPVYDPHGEPIPNADGNFPDTERRDVYDLKVNETTVVAGFRESSQAFLEYMEKIGLLIGIQIKVISLIEYNHLIEIEVNKMATHIISKEIAQKIFVMK